VRNAIRQSVRSLRQRPAFAGFTLALIALGVGASSAIFAVVNGALLKPLPYRQPAALFSVSTNVRVRADSSTPYPLTARELVEWRDRAHAFAGIDAYTPASVKLTGSGTPETLPGMFVSSGIIDLLGGRPLKGRTFRREEEAAGSGVTVISERLWQNHFARDPNILGRTVNIDDEPRQIIGVMPSSFSMLFLDCDVWVPLSLTADRLTGGLRTTAGLARLRDGATIEQGLAELAMVNADLALQEPDIYRDTKPSAVPLRESLFGSQRSTLYLLFGAVLLLVVIGSANVMGLVGADGVARRTATMTRLALGASRRDLLLMRLREGAILAAVAIPLALLGSVGLLGAVKSFGANLPVDASVLADPAVLGFAIVVAAIKGVLTMVPTAAAEASLSISTLAGTATKTTGGRAERVGRDVLLGTQVAVTVVLVVASALLTRNLSTLMNRWPGFEASGVLVAPLGVSTKQYPGVQDRATHVERLLAAVSQVPGVTGAGTIQTRFVLNENMQSSIEVDGHPAAPGVRQTVNMRHVSPSIFGVLRTRVLEGRALDETDRDGSRFTAVVSSSLAKLYWVSESPIGKQLRRGNRKDAPWLEIVGVVEDVYDTGAGVEPGPTLYVSYYQQNTTTARVTLVVRTAGNPSRVIDAVRRAAWAVDPDQGIESTVPLTALMSRSAAEQRARAVLVALFGASGLLLVLTGLYATTQYSVLRRTRELGVRAALGAPPSSLLGTTLVQAVQPAIAGLVVGAIASVPVARLMQSALHESFGLRDAPMIGAVLAAFVALALVAAFIPARCAVTISPTLAMRA
jgi:putative ABC transport system permease protein